LVHQNHEEKNIESLQTYDRRRTVFFT
jgi:hypothetical protein